MKNIFLVYLLSLACGVESSGGTILHTQYELNRRGVNSYDIKLLTFFSLGYGSTCPPLKGYNSTLSHDTVFIKAYYDVSGVWPHVGCSKRDSFLYVNNYSGARYINISTNAILPNWSPQTRDTSYNIFDSTFRLNTSFKNSYPIYPNPVLHTLSLKQLGSLQWQQLGVYNSVGQLIIKVDKSLLSQQEINVRSIIGGLYSIYFYDSYGSAIGYSKFVKL